MAELTLNCVYPDLFTPAEGRLLSAIQDPPELWEAGQRLIQATVPLSASIYLTQGFLGRFCTDNRGQRQFLGLQIPGDYVDLPAYMLGYLDHDIDTIGNVVIRRTPHKEIRALSTRKPNTFQKLWQISLIDASIHRYWAFRLGRLGGRARIANFLCEMLVRLYARGLCEIDRFKLPLIQSELGEICGMSGIHTNRMLAELREEGICIFVGGEVRVINLAQMFQVGHFSAHHLYLPLGVEQELAVILEPETHCPSTCS